MASGGAVPNNIGIFEDLNGGIANFEDSEVAKTFSGASVFITGGTGYLGQLLIEKLLRCCPDLNKIYLLTRPKRGINMHDRLEKQFKNKLYNKVRDIDPNFTRKLVPVAGDCGELSLGLSNDDRIMVTEEVQVIFHSAATVRFDEPLKLAVAINTRGTREMLQLARDCKNLKALLHISTAYSNCNQPEIKEQFYKATLDGDKLIDLVESIDEEILLNITPGLITGHPNTYTYTKKAAEDIIQRHGQDLPIAVVRPSIVTGTISEPIKGWSGNLYGLSGALIVGGVGLLHSTHIDANKVVDGVPGDMVSNSCIVAASKTAREFRKNVPKEPPIYACVSSPQNPITWGKYIDTARIHYEDYPSMNAIYAPFAIFTTKMWLHRILSFLLHWLPAYLIDGLAILIGKKPVLRMVHRKVQTLMAALDVFMNSEWTFSNTNTMSLYNELSKVDKELFNFDFEPIDWNEYIRNYVIESRTCLMKESVDTVEQAKEKLKFLKRMHYLVCSLLVLFLYGVYRGVAALLA